MGLLISFIIVYTIWNLGVIYCIVDLFVQIITDEKYINILIELALSIFAVWLLYKWNQLFISHIKDIRKVIKKNNKKHKKI